MEINKEEITELTELYRACAEEVRDKIDSDIFGYIDKGEKVHLSLEDLRQIATSIFIEYNRRRQKKGKGQGKYSGPSTVPQQKHIAEMAMMGAKNEKIIADFLDANHKKSAEKLTKSEASSLIDLLHKENPRR
jgi:hypothetical protein